MAKDNPDKISGLIINQFPEYYREEGRVFIDFVTAYYDWMESKTNRIHHIINPKKQYVQVTYGSPNVVGVQTEFTGVFGANYAHANSIAIYKSNNEFDYEIFEIDTVVNNTFLTLKPDNLPTFSSARAIHGHVLPQANPSYYTRRTQDILDIDTTLDEFIVYFKEQYLKNIQFKTITDTKTLVKNSLDLYRSKGTPRSVDLLFRIAFGVPAEIFYPQVDIFSPSSAVWFIPKYLELRPAEYNVKYVNREVVGLTSGATAFIQSVVRKTVKNRLIDVAYISAINGNFEPNEKINDSVAPNDISECPTIIGSMNYIDLEPDGYGSGYSIGDRIEIESFYGDQGLARVVSTSNSDGELEYVLIDGGYGYTANAETVIAEKMVILNNVTPNSISTYINDFEPFIQPLANIVFDSATAANAWAAGDTIYAYDGGGNVIGTGVVLVAVDTNTSAGELFVSLQSIDANLDVATYYTEANSASAAQVTYTDKSVTANVIGVYSNVILGVTNVTGTFLEGENVIGSSSANGIFSLTLGSIGSNATISIVNTYNAFQLGDTLSGETSGATANIANISITVGVVDLGSNAFSDIEGNFVYSNTLNTTGYITRISTGSGANLAISSNLSYTETIAINDDLIADYLTDNLNAVTWGFPGDPNGNLTSNTIDNILSFTNYTIGQIQALTSQDPGDNYNIRPIVKFLEPVIYPYNIKDSLAVYISNSTSDFVVGEVVTQNSTSFRGIVEQANSTYLTIKRLRFNANNNLIATVNATTYLEGFETGSVANVDIVSDIGQAEILGYNANVAIDVVVADGLITSVQVLDSGFGFKHGEAVYVKGNNTTVPLGYANQFTFGVGRGFYKTNDGFLSNNKKLQDGYYWQTHSYEVRSSVTLDKYKEMLRNVVHVAGHIFFGNLVHSAVTNTLITSVSANISSFSTLPIFSYLDVTEADDTTTSGATSPLLSDVDYTEEDDTTTTDVDVLLLANATISETDDTLSALVSYFAYVDYTEENDVLDSNAVLIVDANATIIELDDTLDSNTVVLIDANAIITELNDDSDSFTVVADNIQLLHTANLGIYDSQVSGPNGFNRTATWNNVPIGDAAADRIAIFAVTCRDYAPGNEVYFDGVEANVLEYGIANKALNIIAWLPVSSGTTMNVEVRHVFFPSDYVIAAYSLTGANSTVYSSNSAGVQDSSNLSIQVDAIDGGVIIATSYHEDTATTTNTNVNWTGVTADHTNSESFNHIGSIASETGYTASGTYQIDVGWYVGTAEQKAMLAAVFQPASYTPPAEIFANVTYTEADDTTIAVTADVSFQMNFQASSVGELTESVIASDWHYINTMFTSSMDEGHLQIITDPTDSNNKILEVKYDAFTRASDTGTSDIIVFHSGIDENHNTYEDVTLEYKVKFYDAGSGFDFRRGGKLPGLAGGYLDGGRGDGGYPTGGDPSGYTANGDGFSARFMWIEHSISNNDTHVSVYMYDMDGTGDHLRFSSIDPTRPRANLSPSSYSDSWVVNEDTWYTFKQRIKMNSVESNGQINQDGIVQAWVDDTLMLEMTDCQFRANTSNGINILAFSTFFGGSGADYETIKDEYIHFDNFVITVNDHMPSMWLTASEISALPTSGNAYNDMITYAQNTTVTANIADQDNNADQIAFAKGLAYRATGNVVYRHQAQDLIMSAIGTEDTSTDALALSRNLLGYILAADLVGLSIADNTAFTSWLGTVVDESYGGRTVRTTHADRPNNWGTMAGASRLAAAIYTGNTSEIATVAQIFEGWLGNTAAYTFDVADYGGPNNDLSWQSNPLNPVGINPVGATINSHPVDGVLPEEQRRSGEFTWPPPAEEYVYEALQGAVATAVLLEKQGYTDVWSWEANAILRAFEWMETYPNNGNGYFTTGDDTWMPYIINAKYASANLTVSSTTQPGKQGVGFTDWTHG